MEKGKGFLLVNGPIDGGFLGLPSVGNDTRQDVDEKVDRAAMARVFDLRLVLELIVDGFDNVALAQQQFVDQRQQPVLHVGFDGRDELQPLLP